MIKAIEFIENKFPNNNGVFVLRNIEEFMIEFAKMHVKEALTEVVENVNIYDYAENKDYSKFLEKESILNAYPLTNIK
jgi:hypothetical protein